ncbi:MAG: hypothetical protein LBO20_03450, partial [Bifidobacteriaceae bacterium]|nr:hypothetical protein [Bifidobacteriaceae bacterium]
MKLPPSNRTGRILALAAAGLALAGCAEAGAPGAAQSAQSAQSAPAGGGVPEQSPGLSGAIAAVSDNLLQVQDSDQQTAVAYSASTVITQQVAGSAADVVVGVCVAAVGGAAETGADGEAGGASPTPGGGADGEAAGAEEPFAAAAVTISPPGADGTCQAAGIGGFGGGGGGQPPQDAASGAAPGARPSDMPSGRPSDRPSDFQPEGQGSPGEGGGESRGPGGAMFGGMAFGLVTAVDGDIVRVDQSQLAPGGVSGQ